MTHAIKLRPTGTKRFAFIRDGGGQNRLRVHARRCPTRQTALEEIERFRFGTIRATGSTRW